MPRLVNIVLYEKMIVFYLPVRRWNVTCRGVRDDSARLASFSHEINSVFDRFKLLY